MNILYFLNNVRNNIDFFLRNNFIFSRKNYIEQNENKKDIFKQNNQIEHLKYLTQKYDLDLFSNGSLLTYLENLYCLDVLDKYFSINNRENLSILDIGAKNWVYAKSEYLFFNKFSKNTNLRAIEIDAFRLCSSLYTRFEIAKYHTKNLKNTKYISGDFLEHNKKQDYIIWFLPFIVEYPLIKWGLPLRYFKPVKMLEHAYNLLNDDGELLIINQGETEYNIQQNLNKQLNLNVKYFGKIDDIFTVYSKDRYCCKILK